MRTFKHISAAENNKLTEIFPEFGELDWEDSYHYAAFSIWEHWLHENDESHLLDTDKYPEQDKIYKNRFKCFHNKIINSTEVFTLSNKKKLTFKGVRSKESLESLVDPFNDRYFFLVIPEYKLTIEGVSDYTDVIYYKDELLVKKFYKLASECGLKLVRSL